MGNMIRCVKGCYVINVLDHGSVTLRNVSGPTRRCISPAFDANDVDPAQSARMSFDQMDTARAEWQDHKLADYLMRNMHTSPFEMIEIWLEMKLPIFVARQFVRHRTVSINEVSGRYITLPEEWYIPEIVGGKAANKKQGQEDNLSELTQRQFKGCLQQHCHLSYLDYVTAIEQGIAPEHARMLLHLNHYTHWLWKQDLHNMMHFLSLRSHEHAQVEARAYAEAIIALLRRVLPESMKLFDKYRRHA